MTNVVSLKGATPLGEPVPNVVEILEELLEKARSGNLTAIAYVSVTTGNIVGHGWEKSETDPDGVADGTSHALGNGILHLMHRYAAAST